MSSQMALQTLLPQLKSMEDNIIAVIMELSSKLASLTDSRVFVLVEDSHQRKFSGSQHLIDLYLNRMLCPIGNDLELEVSLVPAVVPKKCHSQNEFPLNSAQAPAFDGCHSQTFVAATEKGFAGAKRPAENLKTAAKKKKKSSSETGFDAKLFPSSFTSGDDLECARLKTESDDVDGVEIDLCLDDEDDESSFVTPYRDGDERSPLHSTTPSNFALATQPFNDAQSPMLVNFADMNLPMQKIEFLRSLGNGEDLFAKGSPEKKVLSSLFYDFGKSLREFYGCGDPHYEDMNAAKNFLNANLDGFLELHPHLAFPDLKDMRLDTLTIKTFIRKNVHGGFHYSRKANLALKK